MQTLVDLFEINSPSDPARVPPGAFARNLNPSSAAADIDIHVDWDDLRSGAPEVDATRWHGARIWLSEDL